MTRPAGRATYLLVVLVLLLSGCGKDSERRSTPSPSASPSSASTGTAAQCREISASLLGSVQAYVDSYAPALARGRSGRPTAPAAPSASPGDDTDLKAALQQAQDDLKKRHCSVERFRGQFTNGLSGVKARGPLAQAILLRLTASLTGTLGPAPEQVRIGPRADLPKALGRLASGSTVRLKPGHYRLTKPLVLLAGVTLEGSGRGRTTITSPAAGSALLLLTDEVVQLRRLAVRHVGSAPASVIVTSPGSALGLTDVAVTGGVGSHNAPSAGSGLSMTSGRAVGQQHTTTLEVTRGTFSDNTSAGVLLTGDHRASIRRAIFSDNGQCGVCFGGATSGAVRDSTFTGNAVGVAVFGRARPVLERDRFIGGQVAVQVSQDGAPAVLGAHVDGTTRAAMIFTGSARGRVDHSTCTSVPYGIVVGKKALPYLGENDCHVVGTG